MRWSIIAVLFVPGAALAQETAELRLVKGLFAQLNPRSIAENVEFCGYVGFDRAGKLIASPVTRGDTDSCLAGEPRKIEVITASFHTHGAFSPDYFNEVPSDTDMEGDVDEGIDGWVATPGGRLWYIDTVDMVASQICGIGCLPADAKFIPGDMGHIAEVYAYDDLVELMQE